MIQPPPKIPLNLLNMRNSSTNSPKKLASEGRFSASKKKTAVGVLASFFSFFFFGWEKTSNKHPTVFFLNVQQDQLLGCPDFFGSLFFFGDLRKTQQKTTGRFNFFFLELII